MTITITRTTEFQTTVPDDCEDLELAKDMARMEANHHSVITHEDVQLGTSFMTLEEALTTTKCPVCADGPCLGAVCR